MPAALGVAGVVVSDGAPLTTALVSLYTKPVMVAVYTGSVLPYGMVGDAAVTVSVAGFTTMLCVTCGAAV